MARTRLEVALFLAEDHEQFVKDAGVMGGLIFLLSEAYQKIGTMELHFVGPPEGHEPKIPESIRRVAASHGVVLRGRTRIADAEGRELYARLTGLSAATVERARRRGIDTARACFVVQRRIWSREQVEYFFSYSIIPERIFDGGVAAEARLSYVHDLLIMRIALLAERTQTLFEMSFGGETPTFVMKWTSESTMECVCGAPLRLAQDALLDSGPVDHPAEVPLTVHLWPRGVEEYSRELPRDVQSVTRPGAAALVITTRDCSGLSADVRKHLQLSDAPPIAMIVDTLSDLDQEIEQRLSRATSTRRPLPERPD